jgi:hypothetical protein
MADDAATIEHRLDVIEKTHLTRERFDDDRRCRRRSTSQRNECEYAEEEGDTDHAGLSN